MKLIQRIGAGLLALSLIIVSPNPLMGKEGTVSAASVVKVFNKDTSLKAGAYRSAKVLKHVKKGESASILMVKGSWTKVKAGTVIGWVASWDVSSPSKEYEHPTIRDVRQYRCIPNFTNGKDDLYIVRGDETKYKMVRATVPGHCTTAYPQAVNHRIFYRDGMEQSIYSIRTDGTSAVKIAEVSKGSPSLRIISVTKQRVYYIEKRYGSSGWDDVIISMDHNGKNKRVYPHKGVVDAVVNGSTIYFTAGYEQHLYRIGIDGTKKMKLIGETVYRDFRIGPGFVFYTTRTKNGENLLIRHSLKTGKREVITRYSSSSGGFAVYKDWLYFAEEGTTYVSKGVTYVKMSIKRSRLDMPVTEKELIHAYVSPEMELSYVSETPAGMSYIVGEYFYVVPYDKTKKAYRYHYSIDR
ncbi:DUF5050 domain-containing protein [Exiguobacterium sp. MMG028]|uniref:DUF5050 domain-containing protein n=1 Tax=Exiguobacterium sp. MMG028 TaxID=3021979 RepID=UPI0022FF3066|nr:DUF5050 domain-containing protein [Exiguobacterium sp. MMG028]MDA5560732.1 DUF5050 domain-containing protein [Exiguobacterium sp. MMG028]